MPLLDPSIPFSKTADLTKSLRARDQRLLSLLPIARDLFDGKLNIYFPQRNEWLLEWLAQRLKEEDDPAARASPESWRLLRNLLGAVGDWNTVAAILKRHSVVAAVARAFAELRKRLGEEEYATPREMALGQEEEEEDAVVQNLREVMEVLETLREPARKNGAMIVATKMPVEASAALLGDFFAVCEVLLGRMISIENGWVDNVLWLWRSSVWGNPNTKKISTSWSEKCLYPASALLMESSVPAGLKTTLEEMVSEYIFSADILNPPQPTNSKAPSGLSTKELVALLAPLRSDDATMSGTSDPLPRLHLPVIFSIALKALQQRQLARPDPDTVEAVYRALLLAVIQLDFSIPSGITQEGCNNITALLEVMTSADVALPLTALVEIVVHAANLNHSPTDVRWDIVEQVLRNDFDAFLHPSSNLLKLDLFSTITAASPSDQIFRVIELLIEGFAKARDLLGFVEHWKGGLPAAIWSSNSVKKSFAKRIETSLIPTQIERLVKQLGKEKHWDILDATLRGVHKEETEARLRSEGTLPEIVASASAEKDVCPWRVIVRIADIDRSAISGTMGQARKLLKKMGAENEDVGLLAAEVILKSATIPDPENLDAVQTVLEIGAKGWKNSHKGFALNLSVAVTGPFLSVLEAVDAETRNRYVDCLLEAAISAPASQVRKVWDSMVRNPAFFELLALKDAVFSALLSSLEPYPTLSQNMEAALNNNHDDTAPVATESVALVVDSLMQYPIDAIKRTHRETLLDSCLLLDARGGHASVRPLLHKLWRVGNATSQLTRSVDVFRTLFQHSGADATARRILQHAVANKDQDKIKSFLEDIINASWESSGKAAKNSAQHLAFSWTVVTELWTVLEDEDGAAMTILKQTRNNLLKILDHNLTDITTDMTLQLQMWRKLWSLERGDRESAQNMAARVAKSLVSQQPPLGGDIEFVVEGLELVFTVAESIKGVLAAAALLIVPLEHFPHASHDRILSPYRSFLSRLEPSVHNYSLGCVGDDCLSGKLGPVGWELLKAHVDTIPAPPSPGTQVLFSTTGLAFLYTRLTLLLPRVSTDTALHSIVTCLDSLFRNHQWSMTQNQIDSTISSFTVLSSISGPAFSAPPQLTPETLYLSVLSPVSAMLSFHRRRVRNRYHLLVPLLSNLLSLLFLPPLTRRKANRMIHPGWVLPAGSNDQHLSVTSARAFTRIVQTLCEPPASTVRSHHRGNKEELESAIRKEKKLVAKAVGPLLEVYILRVQKESMDPDVRKEVLIAMGHVAEVLGSKRIGKISDRMTVEARAVLRSLWKDLGLRGRERV